MLPPPEEYRLIPLTQGQFAKVSPEDFEWLNQWKWYAHWSDTSKEFYAYRGVGKTLSIPMHRQILNLWPGDKRQGDHINVDTLDNRRSNLRIASSAENRRNSPLRADSKSGRKGVHWCKTTSKWIARIMVNGKYIYLGRYSSIDDAHVAYCEAAKIHHGDFARTQ